MRSQAINTKCIVCDASTDDFHTHNMSAEYLTSQAHEIVGLRAIIRELKRSVVVDQWAMEAVIAKVKLTHPQLEV